MRYLRSRGYTVTCADPRPGTTDSDIVARKGKESLFVEVIGFQVVPSIRSREFYECFFRAISRDRDLPDQRLIMALPARFANGMGQRQRQYPKAWKKIGEAFPNLEIWYVDTEAATVIERSWLNPDSLVPDSLHA